MDNCIKCGTLMNRGARFCAACGEPAEAEETRVASKDVRATGEETRFASEETRVAAARPWGAQQPPQRGPLTRATRPRAKASAPKRRSSRITVARRCFHQNRLRARRLGGVALSCSWGSSATGRASTFRISHSRSRSRCFDSGLLPLPAQHDALHAHRLEDRD